MTAMNNPEELLREGWEQQGVYDEPRLSELIETYEEIGFEVLLQPFQPLDPFDGPGCTACMEASPERYKTVYTRRISDNRGSKRGKHHA